MFLSLPIRSTAGGHGVFGLLFAVGVLLTTAATRILAVSVEAFLSGPDTEVEPLGRYR